MASFGEIGLERAFVETMGWRLSAFERDNR